MKHQQHSAHVPAFHTPRSGGNHELEGQIKTQLALFPCCQWFSATRCLGLIFSFSSLSPSYTHTEAHQWEKKNKNQQQGSTAV